MALPSPKASPLAKQAWKIKDQIDAMIAKMQKNEKYTPSRDELEAHAEAILNYIDHQHTKIEPFKSHLKAAVIDLTEVPEMAPEMQRIAYLTSLKAASQSMELFLSCL